MLLCYVLCYVTLKHEKSVSYRPAYLSPYRDCAVDQVTEGSGLRSRQK
jgi:hypothetical protein